MSRKMLFIFNPRSGKGSIKTRLLDILDIFVKGGYEVTVHPTQAYMDGFKTAKKKAGDYDIVVASGGDGTLDEIVSGILRVGGTTPIGYIPAGSTNDFANSLHISKNMLQAATDIVEGVPHAFDVGKFNQDFFVYIAAFGLFTDVSYETNQDLKNILGHAAYILEGTQRIFNIKSYKLRVISEEAELEGEFIFGMVSNSTSVGGFKKLTGPDVMLDDGVFEVMFIRMPKTLLELNEIISSLVSGNDTKMIEAFETSAMTVIAEEEIPWTLDGEYGGEHTRVEIQNLKHAVEIMLPVNDKAPLINNINEIPEDAVETGSHREPNPSGTAEDLGKTEASLTPEAPETSELFEK